MNQPYRKGLFVRTDKINVYKYICCNCGTHIVCDNEAMYKMAGPNQYGLIGRVLCPLCGHKNLIYTTNIYKGEK